MTADTFGLLLIVIGIAIYFFTRKQASQTWPRIAILITGIGIGALIGAVWVVNQATGFLR